MKCKYCVVWQECDPDLTSRIKQGTGDRTVSSRYCRKANKRKLAEDDACKDIRVAKFFSCTENGERVGVLVCLYRQGKIKQKPANQLKGNVNCPCSQGTLEIAELQRGRNLLLEHGYISPIS